MTDLLAQLPGYALRRAANAVMGELGDILAEHGFRITEAAVLLLVRDRADLTSSQIGRTLDIQRANMVPLLNRLESAGWVRREPLDGKSMAIVPTAAGDAKIAQLGTLIEQFETELLDRIPAEHRDHLLPALNAIWR
ncbi:MarR family winged helix-turn-helix transcriptional regulator [Novosphingobium sp. TCA1]|uniref:MarR family transcriptional regulator n=1 Tax=Novosphingobium pentaromativorans TaxID=205844 RepID=A0A2W5QNP3_9SPHN|nr:MarR family transcriptional regulator [Novosphingobium sp. TCA1]PZQ53130.1 MAG: MarR family transcriptional regulator [Novosphingobium pentaromativorans]GFE74999.1 MarR family transcriptional regulator [Novosphingobium sp. TCA1]